MIQSERSETLLSAVYAAATNNAAWQTFCDEMSRTTGAAVMMFGHDLANDASLGVIAGGLDPAELRRYHQHYADLNPWMHMNVAMPVGRVGVSDQALERRELFKTEFYNDWLRHQENVVAGPATICHRSDRRLVALAVACRQSTVDRTLPDSKMLLERLAPHIANAIRLSSWLSDNGAACLSHLETSAHAILLIRRSGRVGFMNKAADRLLGEDGGLSVTRSEHVHSAEETLASRLRRSVRAIATGDFASLPGPYRLPMRGNRTAVVHTHILPAEADHRFPCSAWTDPVAGALVVTGPFGEPDAASMEKIARCLGATPAEARLAGAIAAGRSLYDYADDNDLSRHTVRNQMRVLLAKSGCRNQADFVRRLLALTSPFG